jgi:hypothetical protein
MSIFSLVVAIIVISALVYLLLKQKRYPKRTYKDAKVETNNHGTSQLNTELVKSKWTDIEAMQKNGGSGIKNALIEADKLLDYVMIHKGFKGETMGDRLKSGGSKFTNLNGIWAAHKLRNQVVHEVEHDIVPTQLKHAITIFREAIQELGVQIK